MCELLSEFDQVLRRYEADLYSVKLIFDSHFDHARSQKNLSEGVQLGHFFSFIKYLFS